MTLTVRLGPALSSALDRHCAEAGVTKSLVVQQSLAAYLLAAPAAEGPARETGAEHAQTFSTNYRAFENAGLIGAVALDGGSADKASVRARVAESLGQRRVRQGGA